QVARGRVFIAAQAKDLGMVDEIGGVESAIAYAADQVELKPGDFDVQTIPAPKTLADYLNGSAEDTATPIQPKVELSELAIFKALPPAGRSMGSEQLQVMQLMQEHPVVLAAPFALRVK